MIIILLTSAIWSSCRSSKQVSMCESVADTTVVEHSHSMVASDEILSFINASKELDLLDISVEFFPPDSTHPDARAAPKKLTVGRAQAKESTEQASKQNATVAEVDTTYVKSASRAVTQENTKKDCNVSIPIWVKLLPIIAAISLIILLIIFHKSRNETLH